MNSKPNPPISKNSKNDGILNAWVYNQIPSWVVVSVFIVIPGLLIASPMLTLVSIILIGIARTILTGILAVVSRKSVKFNLRSSLIFLLASVGVLTYGFQIDKLIPINGMPIVLSIEKFHSVHNRYPSSLAELNPDYLTEMPRLKPTICQPSIRYRLADGAPFLSIASVSGDAFAEYEYDFKTKAWKHHS